MAYDLYEGLTEDTIYSRILRKAHRECITNRGCSCSFISGVTLLFFETYFLHDSRTWRLSGETACQQATPVLRRINTAIHRLPSGITAEILTYTGDPRDDLAFQNTIAQVTIRYNLQVTVQASYSQAFFSQFCDGNLVHDHNTSYHFRKTAYDFYSRIREKHIETLEKIAKDMRDFFSYYNYDSYDFYVYPEKIEKSDSRIWKFADYGMSILSNMTQAYGMAMALVERLTENTADNNLYVLTEGQYFISVHKLKELPNKLTDW